MRSKFVLRAAGTRQGGRNKMATTRQQPAVWIGGRRRRRRDEKRLVWGAAGGSDRLRWVEAVMCEQAGMWARLGGGKGRRARATNLAKMRSVARWTWVAMDAAGSIGMILKAASAAAVAVEAMAGKQVAVRVEAPSLYLLFPWTFRVFLHSPCCAVGLLVNSGPAVQRCRFQTISPRAARTVAARRLVRVPAARRIRPGLHDGRRGGGLGVL